MPAARSGPQGLDLVRASRPQLVLCDVGLPGMDGAEVCRHVKALPAAKLRDILEDMRPSWRLRYQPTGISRTLTSTTYRRVRMQCNTHSSS